MFGRIKKPKTKARYEIYIPLNYNDGSPVEPEKFDLTIERLMEKVGGITTYPMIEGRGLWKEGGRTYEDAIMIYRIDVEDETEDMLHFLLEYKEYLKKEFKQLEIYMTRQPIEIL